MAETQNAGEVTVETTPDGQQVDYKARFEAAMAENSKLFEEKENYKKGMLQAKGKLPADDAYALARQATEEVLAEREFDAKIKANENEQKAILDKLAIENAELKNALKNGGVAIPVSGGSNLDRPEPKKPEFFTAEQLADMKKRGLDPEKVKANMAGFHQNTAGTGAPAN